MKTGWWIGIGVGVAIVLVVAGLALGGVLIARQLWVPGAASAEGGTYVQPAPPCGGWQYGTGPGMMGRGTAPASVAPCGGWGYPAEPEGTVPSPALSIEDAHEAVEQYIAALGYPNLEVAEVMEFEYNFYAIVRESDTGIGAMELLVDKWTGAVGPEMGPNMMWNGKYGMHGGRGMGMMGGRAAITNTISPEEALQIAQRWLDTYRPGVTVEEHADPFYGYYTIHTLKDGEIEGMLSVHGTTGQVWYHTWHGEFIQMIEGGDDH